jgi:hypothetical protein
MAVAKGSALKATLEYVRTNGGDDVLASVLDALPDAERTRILKVGPTEEIPFALLLTLWHAADAPMRAVDEQWMERAGAYSIDSLGSQLYGNIIRKGSAIEFLTQPIKLFRLFYHSGDMVVVEQEPGRAILRMVDFDEPDKLFCRRQSGGLQRAVELASGKSAQVRHVRCVTEGDAFCEWEIVWAAT